MLSRVPILLLLATALTGAQAQDLDGTQYAQVTIRERVMIRIQPARPTPAARAPVWSEKDSQRCVAVRDLAGGAVSSGGDVDLFLVDGQRIRAKLDEDCPSLSFYAGFYVKPDPDGRICGKRDVLRARSGAACPIAKFRKLELQR